MLLTIPIIAGDTYEDLAKGTALVNPELIGLVEEGPTETIDGNDWPTALLYVHGRDKPLKFDGTVAEFVLFLNETDNADQWPDEEDDEPDATTGDLVPCA
jgi:hypothetical protein